MLFIQEPSFHLNLFPNKEGLYEQYSLLVRNGSLSLRTYPFPFRNVVPSTLHCEQFLIYVLPKWLSLASLIIGKNMFPKGIWNYSSNPVEEIYISELELHQRSLEFTFLKYIFEKKLLLKSYKPNLIESDEFSIYTFPTLKKIKPSLETYTPWN